MHEIVDKYKPLIYILINFKPQAGLEPTRMAEQKESPYFTRQSTGLVRQGRWFDSFVFNSSSSWMFGTVVFALSSIYYFQGADLVSAEGIALVFAVCIAGMYAILTSMMPRSGGDYVFNSRIVHPAFGFSFNFSLTVWQLFSAAFTLFFISNVALGPGLQVLGFYSNSILLSSIGSWLSNSVNSLIFASAINVIFTLLILSGIRKTFSALNVLWIITILGTLVMIAALLNISRFDFQSAFNGFITNINGSSTVANPFNFVESSSASPPHIISLPMIAIVVDSVIWVFWMSYVAGEIRHANVVRRNISSMVGAAILNGSFFIVLVLLLYSRVGVSFLSGIGYLSGGSPSPLPFSSTLQALSAVLVLSTGSFVAGLLVLMAITLGYSVLLLPALYLQPIRSIFAWSFDRVVPERLSSVSSRFHTPIVATLGVFSVIEIALVLITLASNSLLGIYSTSVIAPAFSSIFATSIAAIVIGFRGGSIARLRGHGPKSHVVSLLGMVALGFILFMTFEYLSNESFFFSYPSSGLSTDFLIALNFIFIPVGAAIYFVSYYIRKRSNKIDLNIITSQIPPE